MAVSSCKAEDDSHFEEATILPWSTTIKYEFTGTLYEPFWTVPAGTPFSGWFSYNRLQKNNVVSIPPHTTRRGDYYYKEVSLTVGPYTVSSNTSYNNNLQVLDDYPSSPGIDRLSLGTYDVTGSVGGLAILRLYISLEDSTGMLWSSLGLPGPDLTMTKLTGGVSTTRIWLLSKDEVSSPPRMISASGSIQTLTGKLVP